MKRWCFFIFLALFSACDKNDEEQEYKEVKIKEFYPYVYEKYTIGHVDSHVSPFFEPTLCLVNSIEILLENPLFNYCPDVLKERLVKCDFEQNTLILTSCTSLLEITELDYKLLFNTYFSECEYIQTFYVNSSVEEIEYIYLILTAFTIQKIPEDTYISFSRIFI